MKYNFPKIEISADEKLWLEALYDKFKKGETNVDPRELKALLWMKISKEFEPNKISWHLSSGGRNLTVLGLWHVNPNDENILLLDELLKALQEYLRKHPKEDEVPLSSISVSKDMGIEEKERAFALIRDIVNPQLYISPSNKQGESIKVVKLSGEPGFDFFYKYSGLEDLIRKKVEPPERPSFQVPLLENQEIRTIPNTAFILMWMDKKNPKLEAVHLAIKEVCEEFSIDAKRADDLEHSDQITDRILQEIRAREFLIADLSGERPNVYYEIGFAHAFGKRPILYRE